MSHCMKAISWASITQFFLKKYTKPERLENILDFCQQILIKLSQIPIEHSKNKIITYFDNEVGSGVLQPSVQQTYSLQNFKQKGQNQHINSCTLFVRLAFLQRFCFLNLVFDNSRSDLVSKQSRLRDDFIFRMLYSSGMRRDGVWEWQIEWGKSWTSISFIAQIVYSRY